MISKKNFKEDEKILMEKPFVSCQFAWNQFYQYKACEYCLRPLESAEENVRRLTEDFTIKLPYLKENCTTNKQLHCVCEQCGLEYCSIECKQSALNEYHQVLCLGQSRLDSNHPYNVLMDTWRQLHLPHDEAFDHLARLHRMQWPDGVSNFVRPDAWQFHRSMRR